MYICPIIEGQLNIYTFDNYWSILIDNAFNKHWERIRQINNMLSSYYLYPSTLTTPIYKNALRTTKLLFKGRP